MRTMKGNRIKRVALAFRLSFASHRDIIYGISQYAKTHHWQLLFAAAPDAHAQDKLQIDVSANVDGLITCEPYADALAACAPGTSYPLVLLAPKDTPPPSPARPVGLVTFDNRSIGANGAAYLLSLGRFRSFGFVPENHRHFSLRGRGFVNFLKRRKLSPNYYPVQTGKDGSPEDLQALAMWLKGLPKPTAVMADYDLRASQVLEAAHLAGISIPGQLSVLGVDNDALLCDLTDPPLSSVAPDFAHIGELAAQTLTQLMNRRSSGQILRVHSDSKRIVARESTAPIAPSVHLVERALNYIEHNALAGISAQDVVAALGVSRRLADRRFREVCGHSILETILARRLEAVKEKLATTSKTIRAITSDCGFHSENYAKNLFRKRFGQSMREFRRRSAPMSLEKITP